MLELETTVGNGFAVRLIAWFDSDGEPLELEVYSATTGENLEPLLYDNGPTWLECWRKAQQARQTAAGEAT